MQVGRSTLSWTNLLLAALFAALSIGAGCNRQQGDPQLGDRQLGDHQQAVDLPTLRRVRASQFHMGMMVHLTLWAPTLEEGQQSAAVAFERIGQIDQIMSDYEPESELSCLCRRSGQGPVSVSSELFQLLAAAKRFAELTEGRYDPTAGPLTRLWRKARQTKVPPDRAAIEAALEQVGYQKMLLDRNEQTGEQTVELTHPGMWLDLGSIAKGYAGDEAIRILSERGIPCAAYEAGGDKVFGAAPPRDAPQGERGWHVVTEVSQPKLPPLAHCAVSISGDSAQFFEQDGHFFEQEKGRISHVIDPRSGLGFSPRVTCTVVAPRGIDSDPLATIGTTMSLESYQKLLTQHFPEARATVSETTDQRGPDDPRIPSP